jgi:glycosyltransferase involved in cell wall biosynthesis
MALPPKLAWLGDTMESRIAPMLYRRSQIITLSPSSKREMIELGFHEDRVEVIPPGLDPRFSPGGDPSPSPLVLGVGRLMPVKRFDRLIRAVVEARRQAPELTLTLVGTGPERNALREVVRSLDADSFVTFVGRVSDAELIDLYRKAWAVCSTSVREGWGMTLTEAAACGTPAIATRIPGHVDAIAEGVSGLLADDDAGMVANLVALVNDPVLRTRLRTGALSHAAQFNWTTTATRILQTLAEEAKRHRAHSLLAPLRRG